MDRLSQFIWGVHKVVKQRKAIQRIALRMSQLVTFSMQLANISRNVVPEDITEGLPFIQAEGLSANITMGSTDLVRVADLVLTTYCFKRSKE